VLFEKLIYKRKVNKRNRRVMAAVCLVIIFKQNQVYGDFKANKKMFQKLQQDLQKFTRGQLKKKLKYYEIKVMAKLNFEIRAPHKA